MQTINELKQRRLNQMREGVNSQTLNDKRDDMIKKI